MIHNGILLVQIFVSTTVLVTGSADSRAEEAIVYAKDKNVKKTDTLASHVYIRTTEAFVIADVESFEADDEVDTHNGLGANESLDIDKEEDEINLDDATDEESLDLNGDVLDESIPTQREVNTGIQFGGKMTVEDRYFFHRGLYPGQNYHNNLSVALEPELSYQWDDGKKSLVFKPYFIGDQHDNIRTHFDIRELMLNSVSDRWEFKIGIGKVYWGVMESVHLVDIINQTDFVVNMDSEDKLGQPMIDIAYSSDFGTFDFFVLPYFRERSFPGGDGRIRGQLEFAGNSELYESAAEQTHVDFAVRWAHTLGSWDVGLAHFHGTTREPRFVQGTTSEPQGSQLAAFSYNAACKPFRLCPLYEIIDQTSLDVQGVTGNWLWKLEALTRSGQGARRAYSAAAGTEYTFSGVFESGADLGFLLEYLYNSRPYLEITKPFKHDLFMGVRLGINDVQSTELLAGVVTDLESSTWMYSIEASRRMGDSFKVGLEIRGSVDVDRGNYVYQIREDDYIQLEVEWFY